MGAYRTPIIDKLKTDSASFYTFGSAVEDIGLNINERNNKVAISHYVLLNIPYITNENGGSGVFSINNFIKEQPTREKLISKGDNYIFPKILQNYALNFETVLRNKGTYDFSAAQSVSEKIFWKMLQKSGALHLQKFKDNNGNTYYHEDFSNPDSMVIKGFGQIATSSQSSNTYNMNNETYILIPSSYGQMKYYMSDNFDINYAKNTNYTPSSITNLEGFTEITDTDFPIYDNDASSNYSTNDSFDGVQMEFDMEDIKSHLSYENEIPVIDLDRLTYDNLAYDSSLCLNSKYSFNSILVYYTIYDTNGKTIATNLFGVMVLDSLKEVSNNSSEEFQIPYSVNFYNGYPTDKNISAVANSSVDTVKQLYGNNTTKINIPAKTSATGENKFINIYFTKDFAKELTVLFSTDQPNTTNIQFIKNDAGITDLTAAISLSDISNKNIKITELLGDDGKTIFYKVKYTNEEYVPNIGIRFLNIASTSSVNINLSEITEGKIKFDENEDISNSNHYYTIPSYLKTQTKEGAFGSEYSFRLNIQTASIYDKTSDIIDYSSGNAVLLDDFSGVLSNLRIAIEVLKSNSVVQAKLYNDFQNTKNISINALNKVDILEKDVNNLLHGNSREISADIVDTNTIKAKQLSGDISFVDASNNQVGEIVGDTLRFDKIETADFKPDTLSLSEIKMGDDGFNITKNGTPVFSINSKGEILTSNSSTDNGYNWYYVVQKDEKTIILSEIKKDTINIFASDYDGSISVDEYMINNWYKIIYTLRTNDEIRNNCTINGSKIINTNKMILLCPNGTFNTNYMQMIQAEQIISIRRMGALIFHNILKCHAYVSNTSYKEIIGERENLILGYPSTFISEEGYTLSF